MRQSPENGFFVYFRHRYETEADHIRILVHHGAADSRHAVQPVIHVPRSLPSLDPAPARC